MFDDLYDLNIGPSCHKIRPFAVFSKSEAIIMNTAEVELQDKFGLEHSHVDFKESEGGPINYDASEELRVVRKCDLRVVPILMLLYLLAFLDRINIGNARLQGLEKDTGMKGGQYNYALFIFFIPYILCEVPCNLILKKLAPSTWISGIMVAWGKVYPPILDYIHFVDTFRMRDYWPRVCSKLVCLDGLSIFDRSIRSWISAR